MQVISRKNDKLNWTGRWIDQHGKFSGWGGSALQFKFTGTSLSLELDVKGAGGIAFMLDYYDSDWSKLIDLNTDGKQIINLGSELEDREHTAFIRFSSKNFEEKRNGNHYIKVINVLIDDDAEIIEWKGKKKIGWFGDSWASAGNDFTRFLGLENAEIHSISESGYTSQMGLKYFNNVVGNITAKDPSFDIVVLAYGVNDIISKKRFFYSFKNTVSNLIKKVRETSPNAVILLIQSPKNILINKDYGKYGPILESIAKSHENCIYISSENVQNQLTWKTDNTHLDTNGKHRFGKWLGEELINYL